MRRIILGSLAAAAMSIGCVIVDPSCTSSSASIIVTPTVVVVAVGESFTPSASDRWCDGRNHERSSPNWSLVNAGDSAVVRLNAVTGEITGRRAGRASVLARSALSGNEATVSVTVR